MTRPPGFAIPVAGLVLTLGNARPPAIGGTRSRTWRSSLSVGALTGRTSGAARPSGMSGSRRRRVSRSGRTTAWAGGLTTPQSLGV